MFTFTEETFNGKLHFLCSDTSDISLLSLSNGFKVKVIVFQSNTGKRWIVDLSKNSSDLPSLFFERTSSTRIELIIKNK